jgi:hypothetical protein
LIMSVKHSDVNFRHVSKIALGVMTVCLSVRQSFRSHGTTRLPLDEFS